MARGLPLSPRAGKSKTDAGFSSRVLLAAAKAGGMKDGTYLVPSLLSEAAASVQARVASARPAYRAHTCTRTCRLGRGPRARLHDAATHKRLGARLSAAAIERRDELFVHLCCLFIQALWRAATSARRGFAKATLPSEPSSLPPLPPCAAAARCVSVVHGCGS